MDYSEEISDIQSELLSNIPETYSKVKGTWLWEMMKAYAIKLSELLELLTETADKLNIENLQGDELDAYVSQWTDITRKKAQKASGYITVSGEGVFYKGSVVACGDILYETTEDTTVNGSAEVYIIATNSGEASNCLAGCVNKLVTSNANIKAITNNKPIEGGTEEETDEALRERYYLRLSMPATSGNKAHYILWARECAGVGGAKAIKDTEIVNKINVYICNDNGEAAESKTVELVQNYIDPNKNGDGAGTAPVGAICIVHSAGIKEIAVSGKIELDNTESEEDTLKNVKENIERYLSKINFNKTELSYAKLLNTAISSAGVNDIVDFKLNDNYLNVKCEETDIFSLKNFEMEVG